MHDFSKGVLELINLYLELEKRYMVRRVDPACSLPGGGIRE